MLFNSQHFLWFFVTVWALYWCLARHRRAQNLLLLAASFFFYGYWNWRFLGLIVFSTVVDYFCGLGLGSPRFGPRARKLLLFASLVANLGVLGLFKYYDFFVESAAALLVQLGFPEPSWTLRLILPVGISFYTFQTLSYTIDRYRNQIETEKSLLDFALFVAFFPQLVAGPIVRARLFLPQAAQPRAWRHEDQAVGLRLILWGLFKKAVVADNLAPFVDSVFGAEHPAGIPVRLLAVYAFAAQIYCDFSGYTDIARGAARMLGFDFPWNFRMPYFTRDPSAFWRHWHITLSSWLRDYLYISLGGNRLGPRRTYFNLMATMVLGGLWHGAAWNFVLWGFYQGLLLAVHRLWRDLRGPASEAGPGARLFQTLVFFQLVCLGWLFFRAESMGQILDFLGPNQGGWLDGLMLSEVIASGLVLGGLGTLVVLFWDVHLWRSEGEESPIEKSRPLFQALVCLLLVLGISLFGRFLGNEFIYFQF